MIQHLVELKAPNPDLQSRFERLEATRNNDWSSTFRNVIQSEFVALRQAVDPTPALTNLESQMADYCRITDLKFEREIRDLQARLTELELKNPELTRMLTEMTQHRDTLQDKEKNYRLQIQQLETELTNQQAANRQLEQRLRDQEVQIGKLRTVQSMGTTNPQLQDKEAELLMANRKIQALQAQFAMVTPARRSHLVPSKANPGSMIGGPGVVRSLNSDLGISSAESSPSELTELRIHPDSETPRSNPRLTPPKSRGPFITDRFQPVITQTYRSPPRITTKNRASQ
jgi:hypothetical protein